MELTVRIEKEQLSEGEPIYVATCLELDVAGQGKTVEEAKDNVREAVGDILEIASPSELRRRLPKATTTFTSGLRKTRLTLSPFPCTEKLRSGHCLPSYVSPV